LSSELPAPLQLSPINSPQAQEDRQDQTRTSGPVSPPISKKSQSQGVIELGSSPLVDIPASFAKARIPISNNLSRQPSSSSSSGPSLKSLTKEQTRRANPNPKNPHQSGSARPQSKELSESPIPVRNSHKSIPARQESKELSASPIPVRKKSLNILPPVDPDSSGELSDLDSILARHNPSSHAPNRKRESARSLVYPFLLFLDLTTPVDHESYGFLQEMIRMQINIITSMTSKHCSSCTSYDLEIAVLDPRKAKLK
jgi:hypothetical protein